MAVLGVLVLLGLGTRRVVRRAHDAQVAVLASEYQAQLAEAARNASADLDDLSDVLHLTGEVLASGGQAREHERELRAILEAVGPERVMATYSADGHEALYLPDHRAPPLFSTPAFRKAMADTAARALAQADGRIVVSDEIPGAPSGWLRVFASRFGEPGGTQGSLGVLVDTEPMFSGVRVVGSRGDSAQLVLGPDFGVASSSSEELAHAFSQREKLGVASFRAAFEDLVDGRSGMELLSDHDTSRLGFAASERILSHQAVPMKNGPSWSVVLLASTASVRQGEGRLVTQLLVGAALGLLVLLAVGAYVSAASRRAAALRQTQVHLEELARVNERVQGILDHIPSGVVALSADGRVIALNKALRERASGPESGLSLRTVFNRADEVSLRRIEGLLASAMAAGQVQSLWGQPLSLFGAVGQYSLHAVPLLRGDPEIRIVLVLDDLSSLHALQAQLIQAEKLATVGVLAAGIAHEVGTPLGVVRGRAEYVATKLGAEHAQLKSVNVIIEQIDRVSRTIRQLLDFARMKPATPQRVPVSSALRATHELLVIEAERRGLALDVAIDDAMPDIAADPDQLQQVLVNLGLNALDACERGGHVTLGASHDSRGVRLWVRDSGVGIPPENLHRVFDPFFTTKKRGQGTGLGLSMVAEIVRNHGGRLEVESTVGQGSCMSVFWPSAAAEASHAA